MPTRVTIRFKELWQGRQDLAVEQEAMLSTVYFDVIVGDRTWPNQEANVKLTAGAGFEADQGSLEVTGEPEYEGPKNYQGFRDCVEAYYRSLIGSTGRGIRVGPRASTIIMRNNRFAHPAEYSYEAG